jgi:hypothetical protein
LCVYQSLSVYATLPTHLIHKTSWQLICITAFFYCCNRVRACFCGTGSLY